MGQSDPINIKTGEDTDLANIRNSSTPHRLASSDLGPYVNIHTITDVAMISNSRPQKLTLFS